MAPQPGTLEHLKEMAASYAGIKSAQDYAKTLAWAVEQIEVPPELVAEQERYEQEVENSRLHSVDEVVLEYVRIMSTDQFARVLAQRAVDRRDED